MDTTDEQKETGVPVGPASAEQSATERVATPELQKPELSAGTADLEQLPDPFTGSDPRIRDIGDDSEHHPRPTFLDQEPFELSPDSRAALADYIDYHHPFPDDMVSDDFDPIAGTINPALLQVPTYNSGINPHVEEAIRDQQQNGTLFQTTLKAAHKHQEITAALKKKVIHLPVYGPAVKIAPAAAEPKPSAALANAITPEEIEAYNQALFDESYQEIMDDLNNNEEARAQRAMPAENYRNPITGLTHEEERNLAKAAFKPGARDVFMGAPAFPVNADLSDPLGIGDDGFDYSKAFDNDTTYSLKPYFDNLENRQPPIQTQPVTAGPAARAPAAPSARATLSAPASRAPSRKAAEKAPVSSTRGAGRGGGRGAAAPAAQPVDNIFKRPNPPPTQEQEEYGMYFEAEFNRIMAARGHDPERDIREAETPWRENDWGWLHRNLNDEAQAAMENTLYHPDMNLRGIPASERTGVKLRDEDRILAEDVIMDHRDHPEPSHIAAINRGRQAGDVGEPDSSAGPSSAMTAATPKPASGRKRPAATMTQQSPTYGGDIDDDDGLATGQGPLTRSGPFAGPGSPATRTPQVSFATPSKRRGAQPQTPQGYMTPTQHGRATGTSRTPATSAGRSGPASILKKPSTAQSSKLPARQSAPSPEAKPITNPAAFFPSYTAVSSQPYDTHMFATHSENQDLLRGIDLRPSTAFTRNNPNLARLPIDVPFTPGFLPVTGPASAPDNGYTVQQQANVSSAQQIAAAPAVAQAQAPVIAPTGITETIQPAQATQLAETTQPAHTSQPTQAPHTAQAAAAGARKGKAGLADISPPPSRPGTSAGPQQQG